MEKPLGNLHIMTGSYRQRDNLRRNKALRAMKREMIFESQIQESLAKGFQDPSKIVGGEYGLSKLLADGSGKLLSQSLYPKSHIFLITMTPSSLYLMDKDTLK